MAASRESLDFCNQINGTEEFSFTPKQYHKLVNEAIHRPASQTTSKLGLLCALQLATEHHKNLLDFAGIIRASQLKPKSFSIVNEAPTQINFVLADQTPLTLIWEKASGDKSKQYLLSRTGDWKALEICQRAQLTEVLKKVAKRLPTPLQLMPCSI